MRWNTVIPDWLALLEADAELIEALDGKLAIYHAGANRPVKIPSVEWMIRGDTEGEWLNEIEVQVDFWARGTRTIATIEQRIRRITHRDNWRVLGSEKLQTRLVGGQELEFPSDTGVRHKLLIFAFVPVRDKYAA